MHGEVRSSFRHDPSAVVVFDETMLRDDQASQFISKSHVTWDGFAEAWQPVLLRWFSVLTPIDFGQSVKDIEVIHHALHFEKKWSSLAEDECEYAMVHHGYSV